MHDTKALFLRNRIVIMINVLKEVRKRKNITQEELAKMVGVSRQSINAIERGKYVPSTLLSMKISEIFNTSVNALFQLEPKD